MTEHVQYKCPNCQAINITPAINIRFAGETRICSECRKISLMADLTFEPALSPRERVIQILKASGIVIDLGGCGCCGSPWFEFYYQGKLIYKADDAHFELDDFK